MSESLTKALSALLKEHTDLAMTRQETLVWLVHLVLRIGTVSLWRLSAHVPGRAQTSSVHRRFERFFQHIFLDGQKVAKLLVQMTGLSGTPWTLALDRTNWKFGKVHINILVLGVIRDGLCIPLFWVPLPKAGNSNADERTGLLGMLLSVFPGQSIGCILGDREFIGPQWLGWMYEKNLPFVMRVRDNIHVWNTQNDARKLCDIAAKLKRRRKTILPGQWFLGAGHTSVHIVIMRLKTGELLVLAVNGVSPKKALALYRERWGIETLFSCLKKRGLGLENTHMNQPKKISTLIAVLAIAFCLAFKTGRWIARHKPPATKRHGYCAMSLFALGLNVLRKLFASMDETMINQCITKLYINKKPPKTLLDKAF